MPADAPDARIPERYSRQIRFAPIGPEGQRSLARSRVLVLGCGALGCAIAEQLARAGVGTLRLVDRDFVEVSNLQRQSLFSEDDAARSLPKSVAAASRLRAIVRDVRIDEHIVDVDASTISGLIAGCDLAMDGTDNFRTRHLLNEACARARVPWVYGACVGAYGCSLAILPGDGPCLRCIQDELPAAGDSPTCDTAGIIPPIVQVVAGWQVAEALKILVGASAQVRRDLWTTDLWSGSFQRLDMARWRDPRCAVCGTTPTYPLLSAPVDRSTVLCGRDAIQLRRGAMPDLVAITNRLATRVEAANEYLVRWSDGPLRATCFKDGRVIVQGTADPAVARTMCDRWLG
ncbi:MAG: ThiF family adenylyltransferase [Planctomycetes bacterium]|nr:ThiF family adenylyltransferase [Planctomycetota bacterium]